MFTRRIAVVVAGSALGGCALYALMNADLRGTLSALCEHLASDPAVSSDLARDAFTNQAVDPPTLPEGHTHKAAAAARTSATNFARKMATHAGVSLYVVEMSKSDQRKGLKGSRKWYWAKDANVENRSDPKCDDDIRYICDVDYYMDMPAFLSTEAKPTLLYTVVPESASSVGVDDSTLFFEEDGSLTTLVSGGGTYQHHLWDYAGDSVLVSKTFWGIPTKLVVYALERKQVAVNRQLVLFAPVKEFGGLAALIASCLLEGKRLERFNPIVKAKDGTKFVRFEVHKNDGTLVTTGRPGLTLSATIPTDVDAAIAGVARLSATKLMLPTTSSWLPREERPSAVILTEYHRHAITAHVPVVYPVQIGVRAYQYEPRQFDQDALPKLQAFMSPLVHAAFAPVPNAAGERAAVKGRIEDLKKAEPKPNSFRDRCIEEFADLIVEDMVLHPVDFETVEEKQTRPAQKLSLAMAALAGPYIMRILKCFMKAEAYPDVKDGRNISTYNDSDKLEMSQFALAMSDWCKRYRWYGPGMTPLEIANRVAEICMHTTEFLNISDLHRMDGTISHKLREVDRAVMMRAFRNFRDQLNELLKRNSGNRGILPHGTSFEQGSSHASGCPATSLFQTLRAAFTAYLGFRRTGSIGGREYCPRQAFEALGLHLGDDGVDADLPVDAHLWAARTVGLVLEASVVPRVYPNGFPGRGVNFLARYYSPEVWQGCVDSMCDIKRQLSKFHTTVRLPESVSAEVKLVEKAASWLASDSNTPVLGPLCQKVLLLSDYAPQGKFGIGSWWSKFDGSTQYPNGNSNGWMDSELELQFPEFDRALFDHWLAGVWQISQVLAAPLCAQPKPATPSRASVVVDGDVLPSRAEVIVEEVIDFRSVDEDETKDEERDDDGKRETPRVAKWRKVSRITQVAIDGPTKTRRSKERKSNVSKPKNLRDERKAKL